MTCPKCKSPMEKVNHQGVEVDRCTGCKGLWFDLLEQEDLKKLEGSHLIDIGDSKTGKKQNQAAAISCPSCGSRMIGMVDREQPHIWYESCSKCYGVFFDAGEFKDFKENNILDGFKRLLSKARNK